MIFLIIQLNFVWNDLIDFDIDKKIDIENSKLSNFNKDLFKIRKCFLLFK